MKGFYISLAVLSLALAAAAGVIYSGIYNIAATEQHLALTYRVLDFAMHRAVQVRARDIEVPPLDDPALREQGLILYQRHCLQCHGAPGVAPEPFALGLTPLAANLAYTARQWPPEEIFWVIQNGIKMTGMPAWKFRLPHNDLWALTAFVETLPSLSPLEYNTLVAAAAEFASATVEDNLPADPERGRSIMRQYACTSCHEIPGVVGADTPVGPPLAYMGTRRFIAGSLRNTPANMVLWLRTPQQVNPGTAMPDLGVSERDARDMAAYLATLK